MPFNDQQRGQLFWLLPLFSWGILPEIFLFTPVFSGVKFIDFKKLCHIVSWQSDVLVVYYNNDERENIRS